MANKIAIEVEIKNIKRVADLKKELKDLRKEQKEAEKQAKTGQFTSKKAEKQYIANAKAIGNKSKQLRTLNKNLRESTRDTTKSTKASNGLAKQFIKGAAAIGIVVGAFRAVNRVVSSVISTFSEFEFVMAKVNAVSGATDQEFQALTKTAEELGRTTFFTATQVGELMLNFSKLGFTATEIQAAVQPTLDLATATGSDLARAALVAGAAVRGFALDASETQRVVDVMAVAFSSSAMNIEKWQTSMTKVAPIAKAAGFSIEDTAAIMSKLTDSGIEASIAGTSLRNILLKMQDPSSDLSKSFGTTIHSLDELVPAMKKFVAEGGSMADIMEVVDLRQAAAFEQMLTTADSTLALRDSLRDANGEGARMAAIVGDTLQGAFLKFTSALQGLSISVMKGFAEGMQSAVENAAKFFNTLAKNSNTIIKTIKAITTLAKWIGLYKVGVIAANVVTKVFAKSQVVLRWAMIKTTGVTMTLTGAFTALRVAAKSAMSASGVGLILVGLSEIIPMLTKTKEETDEVIDSTERMTKSYFDSIKPIEGLKTNTDQLVKAKERMNKMVDDGLISLSREGKIIEGNAKDQKLYNTYKGQAAILMRGLNNELKNNNQDMIDEATSIDNIRKATDNLIDSLTNQALVKGFQGEIEKITQKSANATVFLQKLADDMGLSINETTGKLEGFTETIATGMYPDQSIIDQNNKAFGETVSLMLAFEDAEFDNLEHLYQVLADTDGDIESATKAYDRLAGGDGIGKIITSFKKAKVTTKGLGDATADLAEEFDNLDKSFISDVTRQAYVALMNEVLNGNMKMKDAEKELFDFRVELLENLLEDESLTYDERMKLEEQLIKMKLKNADEIAKANKKEQKSLRKTVQEYSDLGSALQTVAGESQALNGVREVGIAISKAAAIAESILTLQKSYQAIQEGKLSLATIFGTKAKIADTVATNTQTAAVIADTTVTGVNTVATNVNTSSTTLSAATDTASIIPAVALGAAKQTKLPFPFNIIAVVATLALLGKIMKMFEKGGIISDGSNKFARGGMVNGPSHTSGGVKFAVGGTVSELEGGEAVINKRSTAMFRNELSSMNEAGGGVKFANGGLLNQPAFAQQKFSATNNKQQGSQKVYVVEADISQSQNSVSVLEAAATI